MELEHYDLCVIGGGINGAGIARDAAGRGFSVILLEAEDLAGATSSASTKLIHGGLRYLETYEFSLVKNSLKEREVLLQAAPHIIWPMEFVLPHDAHLRPAWIIRAGLFLYDHLARRKRIEGSRAVTLQEGVYGTPLSNEYTKGFVYSDCWAEDSRLVVLNAMDAAAQGAKVLTRASCTKIHPQDGRFIIDVDHAMQAKTSQVSASCIVNAAGPWVRDVIEDSELDSPDVPGIRLVKGSHIIVRKMFEGAHAYILQQKDGRIVFVIPYERDFTLIGTTDVEFEGDPRDIRITDDETEYLCAAFNAAFAQEIGGGDVLWNYSGVRPLLDDGQGNASKVTRDYKIHVHDGLGAPMISVFGGKLTSYRTLSQEVMRCLDSLTGKTTKPWTAGAALPGGDMPNADFDAFILQQKDRYFWVPQVLLQRYCRAYGTRIEDVIGQAVALEGLGADYGNSVYEAELRYLIRHEFALTPEDILWRRSKLGLHISTRTKDNIEKAFPALLEEEQS